jgi:hypothetical protein
MNTKEATKLYDLPDSERFGSEFGKFILSTDNRLKELACLQGFDLEKQNEVCGHFHNVVWNYWRFSQATNWCVDFIDADGAFGMLLTGDYHHACLVAVGPNGKVSGHS